MSELSKYLCKPISEPVGSVYLKLMTLFTFEIFEKEHCYMRRILEVIECERIRRSENNGENGARIVPTPRILYLLGKSTFPREVCLNKYKTHVMVSVGYLVARDISSSSFHFKRTSYVCQIDSSTRKGTA